MDGGLFFLFNKSKLRQIIINHQTLIRETPMNSEIVKASGKLLCQGIKVKLTFRVRIYDDFGFLCIFIEIDNYKEMVYMNKFRGNISFSSEAFLFFLF